MKNLKKVLLALLILFTVVTVNVFAYNMDVRVIVDGKIIESEDLVENKDKTGFISNNRTYVPLRLIGENLKCDVNYNSENKDIDISREDLNIKMNVNSSDFTVDGENKTMDVQPIVYNNRTYIPIRYIGETFDKEVEWDKSSRTCIIGDKGDIDLEKLKDKSEKTDEEYEVYTFGNPKVTVKVPKEMMKDLVVAHDYYNNGIVFYEAISYDDDEKRNGYLMFIRQVDRKIYDETLEEGYSYGEIIDTKKDTYLTRQYIIFQDLEEIYGPLIKTPHYNALLDKLNKDIIVIQENDKYTNKEKYKTFTFGNPKVNVKIPTDILKNLTVVENENGSNRDLSIIEISQFIMEKSTMVMMIGKDFSCV